MIALTVMVAGTVYYVMTELMLQDDSLDANRPTFFDSDYHDKYDNTKVILFNNGMTKVNPYAISIVNELSGTDLLWEIDQKINRVNSEILSSPPSFFIM